MSTEFINTKPSYFNLEKQEALGNIAIYKRLINWVKSEFDLSLMDESDKLKVYIPNGCFGIWNFKNEDDIHIIKIKVECKSKVICATIMNQLEGIYNHARDFEN